MKRIQTVFAVVAVLLMAACGSSEKATKGSVSPSGFASHAFVQQLAATSAAMPRALASKLKFSAQIGGQDISVGGQLRMKRDEVIRVQLMALGIVEAGRLEFTPDYVLLMDRINKQYVKARYAELDFLRQSGINFYTLQALFWNQLFQPGKRQPQAADFVAELHDGEVTVMLPEPIERLSYTWIADARTARIQTAKVDHSEAKLTWQYADFKSVERYQMPTDMQVTVDTQKKTMKVGLQLSSLSADDDWESLTTVSSKYKQVTADDILKRLMSL